MTRSRQDLRAWVPGRGNIRRGARGAAVAAVLTAVICWHDLPAAAGEALESGLEPVGGEAPGTAPDEAGIAGEPFDPVADDPPLAVDADEGEGALETIEELGTLDAILYELGEASFYHPRFEGRRTASGEAYRGDAHTAAHRTLPFGTLVRVTNLRNGHSAVVRINDRGPFHPRRVIDLSRAAARELGMLRSGRVPVQVEVLD